MTVKPSTIRYDAKTNRLYCEGDFTLANLTKLKMTLSTLSLPSKGEVIIDGSGITKMDSAGAWLLNSLGSKLKQKKVTIHLENFDEKYQTLISIIEKGIEEETGLPERKLLPWVARVGKNSIQQANESLKYLNFVGKLSIEALRIFPNPASWRWSSLASVIYRNGYEALPIIALLSFMIGVVLTYQMGLQLRNYGANIFIVDLLGLAVTREFGPLLTAIMVAGRTGSAFTAQLGMMKINQEIDALDTMGVTPGELLLLPRIIGLVITLPLLSMWADIFGIVGGMVMSNNMLGITWFDFLQRFPTVIPLRHFLIGIGKAPVFALIIASIGCFQGVQVTGSADSVGRNTTRSVVLSIFFIIVADAIFSIIFSKLQL